MSGQILFVAMKNAKDLFEITSLFLIQKVIYIKCEELQSVSILTDEVPNSTTM